MKRFVDTKLGFYSFCAAYLLMLIGAAVMLIGACWADGDSQMMCRHIVVGAVFCVPLLAVKAIEGVYDYLNED